MIHPIDNIADVMQIPGNSGQLHRPLRIAKGFENVPRHLSHPGNVGKAVFRKAQSLHGGIGLGDIYPNRRIPADFFKCHFSFSISFSYRFIMPHPCKKR